ncbi:MAG: hypothetical protein A3A86_08240, partial [Elusimicrobia bacterium RIFCSPLOWO2_01_FULL_60_11]
MNFREVIYPIKFSTKVASLFLIAFGLTIGLSGYRSVRGLESHLLDELKESLHIQARAFTAALPADAFSSPQAGVQALAQKTGQAGGNRITLIRRDGKVLADSQVRWEDIPRLENHQSRPEIVDAYLKGMGTDTRHSHTVGSDLLYIAVPVPASGPARGAVRMAMSTTRVQNKVKEFTGIVLFSSALALGLAGLLTAVLARWVTRPLMAVTAAAKAVSEGDLAQKVRVDSGDEFGLLAQSFNEMTEKLAQSLSALRSEKEGISRILGSMVETVAALDASGRLLYVNPAGEMIFGVTSADSAGKFFSEVIRQATLASMIQEVLEKNDEVRQEIRLFLPEESIFDAQALPIRSHGHLKGVLLVLHDITRIHQLEEVRRDFVANVSHELRTPLTSIQGYAETLLSGALSDEKHARDFLTTIQDQAERLSRLVNDLLDLSSIESGKNPPKISSFSLRELAAEVAESLSPQDRKHKVRFENNIPAGLPDLNADRDQMKQVLINLADNGIKFNREKGTVTLEAKLKGNEFEISVKDTGVGI